MSRNPYQSSREQATGTNSSRWGALAPALAMLGMIGFLLSIPLLLVLGAGFYYAIQGRAEETPRQLGIGLIVVGAASLIFFTMALFGVTAKNRSR